jgi:hypothetical protein
MTVLNKFGHFEVRPFLSGDLNTSGSSVADSWDFVRTYCEIAYLKLSRNRLKKVIINQVDFEATSKDPGPPSPDLYLPGRCSLAWPYLRRGYHV